MAKIIQFPFPNGRQLAQFMYICFLWDKLKLSEIPKNEHKEVGMQLKRNLDSYSDTELARIILRQCPAILKPVDESLANEVETLKELVSPDAPIVG
jgi:hypothetical protein|tara:strand:+ start:2526 stop:2813 length:288 start_codon:yes stop_codon:yes gene_type:complete